MPLYELGRDRLISIDKTTFTEVKVKERTDLQRLLRSQIEAIVPDGLVLAEEFGNWEDSSRRIDLLVLDKTANLVVVELKRTEDGGHMELQAIRYAAMVSAMTWEQAVESHRDFLQKIGSDEDAETRMLSFLGWDEPDKDAFAKDVRIVLASADFSKELTTAVLWLNQRDLDIRCVRMVPYIYGGQVLVDIQQVIPLPEAEEFQVRLREKALQGRAARLETNAIQELRQRFWAGLLKKANAVMDLHKAVTTSKEQWLVASNYGIQFGYTILNSKGRVELYINRSKEENKAIFDELYAQREQIEAAFGEPLVWSRNDEAAISHVKCDVSGGNIRDESTWQTVQANMVAVMQRFYNALNPFVEKYRQGETVVIPPALGASPPESIEIG